MIPDNFSDSMHPYALRLLVHGISGLQVDEQDDLQSVNIGWSTHNDALWVHLLNTLIRDEYCRMTFVSLLNEAMHAYLHDRMTGLTNRYVNEVATPELLAQLKDEIRSIVRNDIGTVNSYDKVLARFFNLTTLEMKVPFPEKIPLELLYDKNVHHLIPLLISAVADMKKRMSGEANASYRRMWQEFVDDIPDELRMRAWEAYGESISVMDDANGIERFEWLIGIRAYHPWPLLREA